MRTRGLLVVLCAILLARTAGAERLPVTVYTTANGLPHDRVKRIVRDSRGFLWFATAGGVSRFDGERFVTYGIGEGLSHASINDILEARDGTYWIATNGGGVCRFTPGVRPRDGDISPRNQGRPRVLFTCRSVGERLANRVNALLEDRGGRIWAATDAGLFRLDRPDARGAFAPVAARTIDGSIWALVEDATGDVWVGGSHGLTRHPPGDSLYRYDVDEDRRPTVWELLVDREGRLWIGHDGGVLVVRPPPARESARLWLTMLPPPTSRDGNATTLPRHPGEARALTFENGPVTVHSGTFHQAKDGRVWLGSDVWAPERAAGVSEFDGRRLRAYGVEQGLVDDPVIAIGEDRDGNLWLGTLTRGAIRIAAGGLTSYDEHDGIPARPILATVAGHDGALYAVTDGPWIYRFDGARFRGVRPNTGAAEWPTFYHTPLLDRRGEWWIPTERGLYRFARVPRFEDLSRVRPLAVYGSRTGLPADDFLQPFEDVRGDIWFGVNRHDLLVRWERATGTFRVYGPDDGLSQTGPPIAFREDRAGNLWIGFEKGVVARYRRGRLDVFRAADGVPPGHINALHLDRAGRLWIGSRDAGLAYVSSPFPAATGGAAAIRGAELARIDNPAADRPRIAPYPPDLLSGVGAHNIIEDDRGRLYIGSDRGVTRFDPATGSVRRYTTADGLPSDDVESTFRDAGGALWLGTWRGIARLMPEQGASMPPPAMVIGQVRVRGVSRPIAELGETEMAGLELAARGDPLEIEFFALAFGAGRRPLYQYRLEGADDAWSLPGTERRVTYVSLSPGPYRFLARAVTPDGGATTPAVVSFVVLPPVWQRPWFSAVVLGAAALVAVWIHRARVARLLAVERMRTRIATDLHDDIGASLSQIAVLSEVVRRRRADDPELDQPLERIAATARELVDSMSDIVWAINPRRDAVVDLAQRMRRFASDALAARGIEFTFDAAVESDRVKLNAEVRRHVLLVFKESINNLARHSGSSRAAIALSLHDGRLVLEVADEGRGFDPDTIGAGHGLASMRARAHAIAGTLQVVAAPGRGTRLRLEVPSIRLAGRSHAIWGS